MNVLKTELKRGICSWRFAGSVLLILLIGLAGAGESFSVAESYLQMEHSPAGVQQAGWILLQGVSQSELFLMAAAMSAAFSYAAVFYEEAENRFVLMSLSRTSYKTYVGTKVFVTAFSGGVCVICAFCLQTIFCILAVFSSGEFFGEFIGYLGQHMLLSLVQWAGLAALSGAFWAVTGGISAVVMKSRYMAYMAPFILYYILSEFQSRYYPELYFLSPREWVVSKYLSVGVRYGILITALCLAGGIYAAVMRRRVAHV